MTTHKIIAGNSRDMKMLPDESIDLIVTSPPYPMVEMWDELFGTENPEIKTDLKSGNGIAAFYKMHEILCDVWKECNRVLKKSGFACINVGDATRTIGGNFQLYSNHTQVINQFFDMGYNILPDIHWRKQSNAPNKFMGSGMYPAGAYVTYEHEYILIFRKGGKRSFESIEKKMRQKSAFFWEERNIWFSDLWDIKGVPQIISPAKAGRERSAAFPFEIPYRLINMYSVEGDTVLDPFSGLGTTVLAAMASNRNSIGIEVDADMVEFSMDNIRTSSSKLNSVIKKRIENHSAFIEALPEEKKEKCYDNIPMGHKVKTKQEIAIKIDYLKKISIENYQIVCEYE